MKRQSRRARKITPSVWRRLAVAGGIAVLAAVAFISLSKGPASPSDRTVALVHGNSGPQTGDAVHFVDGIAPTEATSAIVLTDSNCTPDGQGISHCFNTLRLPNGHIITVRHDHDMHMVPCLAPGESIRLLPRV